MFNQEQIPTILYDRFVLENKDFFHYSRKYNISKEDYISQLRSIVKCQKHFQNEFIVKLYKLFKSKVKNDEEVFAWNEKDKGQKKPRQVTFTNYSSLDKYGKSNKLDEKFELFFDDAQEIYNSQTKSKLGHTLQWVMSCKWIRDNEHVCHYCGISEAILSALYTDETYTCKTKRNRGAWFELDRKDASAANNCYTKHNIVFCCYFCNNHKSDVINVVDMRKFFGKSMFEFLIHNYEKLNNK